MNKKRTERDQNVWFLQVNHIPRTLQTKRNGHSVIRNRVSEMFQMRVKAVSTTVTVLHLVLLSQPQTDMTLSSVSAIQASVEMEFSALVSRSISTTPTDHVK